MAYQLEGQMLEICSCETICPCFIGELPDNGACDVAVAWHMDKGSIEGVDVAGTTIAVIAHIPGSDDQQEALLNVFTGKLGGPIADVAGLIGEVVGVERVPIAFSAENGKGNLQIGDVASGEMEPYLAADGTVSTLTNVIFSGSPGAPALLGRAPSFRIKQDAVGIDLELSGHNAVECNFVFEG